MSTNKKTDDDETPAAWAARNNRHTQNLRSAAQQATRRRSEREGDKARVYNAASWQPERPLIDRIDNAWRNEKQQAPLHHDETDPLARCCDPEEEGSCPNVTGHLIRSKKWRRLFIVLIVLLGGFVYLLRYQIVPVLEEDHGLRAGFLRQPKGTFGYAMAGDYGIAEERIAILDESLLPGGSNDEDGKRRLVFVGDIHGCKDELLQLLRQVDFDEKTDHLIATGDVISKGPDSPGVIDELIRLNATSVRGNHEDRILTLAAVKVEKFGQPEQLSKAAQKDSKLLKQLKPRHLDYLHTLPLILRIPPLPLTTTLQKSKKQDIIHSEILVVHAGLVPAVPLRKQDPYFVMNMRSLQQKTHVPFTTAADKKDRTIPWTESWNWFHSRLARGRGLSGWHKPDAGLEVGSDLPNWVESFLNLFRKGGSRRRVAKARLVVYGHDSKLGFVNKQWTKGLDSACVSGGELTAMVLDAHGVDRYHSVKCKDRAS